MRNLGYEQRHTFRLQYQKQVNDKFKFQTQVIGSVFESVQDQTSYGFLVAQSLQWKPYFDIKLTGRFMVFDGGTYDNRLYIYENVPVYNFSIPFFFIQGFRYFLMSQFNLSRRYKLWFRLAQTRYNNIDQIGSGFQEINSNHITDVMIQFQMKLGGKVSL